MSKQRRPRQAVDAVSATPERARSPVAEWQAVGNQAAQHRLPEVELDGVREVAVPWVDRAGLALQLRSHPPEVLGRFVAILERSHLPDDRKEMLIAKLQGDQATAAAVHAAVERFFGEDSGSLRGQLVDALDAVASSLAAGTPTEDGAAWQVGDTRLALSNPPGSVSERALALVADLAEALAPPELASSRGGAGRAVAGVLQAIQLSVLLDEEEEEAPVGDYAAEESGF